MIDHRPLLKFYGAAIIISQFINASCLGIFISSIQYPSHSYHKWYLFHLTYTISSVTLFLYQLFVSIRKGFITRSLGLKRSQEYSYAQQAAGTSGFLYFAGNCIYFENEHKRHSLFLCLNAGKGGLRKQMIPELTRHKRKETLCQSKELRTL